MVSKIRFSFLPPVRFLLSVPAFLHTQVMISPLIAPTPTPVRRGNVKITAIVLCIATAFALAFILKPRGTVDRPYGSAAPTIDDILASIPQSQGDSASEKGVIEAVARVRNKPTEPHSWVSLGDTLAQRLRDSSDQTYFECAEKVYLQALRLDPKWADAMNGMAWVTGGRHRFPESIEWANKALKIAPDSADAHGILGDAAVEMGDYDLATDYYQKMMDLRPDLSSWSRGGYLLWLTGDSPKAIQLMEQAIRAGAPFAENSIWCRAKLATMHLHAGDLSAAAGILEPSLRVQSRNPQILLAAARLAVASRDFEVAEKYFRMLLEKGPNHDALVGLGDLRAIKDDKAGAESFYVQVDALHAAHQASGVHDHVQMAKFLADHDRNLIEALRLAEQHKLTRNVIEADVLAWVYLKNGDNTRAIEAIKRALAHNTPDAEIHYHAGMIAAAAGDIEAATRHLQKAIAMNPEFSLLQARAARRALEKIGTRETAPTTTSQNKQPEGSR